mgnify:FL=1
MKQTVIRYTLIILVIVVVAIYLGSIYMYKQNTETGDSGDSVETSETFVSIKEYTLPANIGKKTGPHAAYDPHAALTP